MSEKPDVASDLAVTVRRADLADAAFVTASEAGNLGVDAWPPGLVEAGLADEVPTVAYLIAETGGGPVGHAVVSVAGDIGELQRIAVDAAARRTGAGSALLARVVDLAREQGADRLLLEVREDNAAARSFYEAKGFAEIDRRPRYYRDGAAAVVMLRQLVS